jgi:hypothetical protein
MSQCRPDALMPLPTSLGAIAIHPPRVHVPAAFDDLSPARPAEAVFSLRHMSRAKSRPPQGGLGFRAVDRGW